jgi:hypothetical protein
VRIHIEPTSRIVTITDPAGGGTVPARIWEGTTDGGTPVICWLTRIAASRDGNLTELEEALTEVRAPTDGARSFPRQMIL